MKTTDTDFQYDMIINNISERVPQIRKATKEHTCDTCKVNIYKGDRTIRDGILFFCVKCMETYLSQEEHKAQLIKDSITKCITYVKKNKKGWLKEQMINRLEG